MFLGVPFNIASYSLLIHILAKECGYEVGEFIHSLGDFHIYEEHFDQVKIQLTGMYIKELKAGFLQACLVCFW